MSVTESERNQLFNWFEEHMGQEKAETIMRLLPPVGWADVATKRDLDALGERLDGRIDALDGRIDALGERFEARLDTAAATARADVHDVRGDLHQVRADLQRTFITWMFAAHGATVAAIGLLFTVLR